MKKVFVLICYHLGLWGFVGFVITLIIGFIACCANLSVTTFYVLLVAFATIAITVTTYCIIRKCKKDDDAFCRTQN